MTSQTPSQDAKPFILPFDYADADLVIRTSDDARFAVHTLILTHASDVFADMFALPQPGATADAAEWPPVVDLSETKTTVLALLQLCYPTPARMPSVGTLDEFCELAAACDKYGMGGAKHVLEVMCPRSFVEEEPLRVYVAAIRAKSVALARDAALQCLHGPMIHLVTAEVAGLRSLPAACYQSLLRYHLACCTAAAEVITSHNYPWVNVRHSCWVTCGAVSTPVCPNCRTTIVDMQKAYIPVKQWWMDWMYGVAQMLQDYPCPTSRILSSATNGIPISLPCPTCSPSYISHLNEFLPKLEEEVKRAVAAVRPYYFPASTARSTLLLYARLSLRQCSKNLVWFRCGKNNCAGSLLR